MREKQAAVAYFKDLYILGKLLKTQKNSFCLRCNSILKEQ